MASRVFELIDEQHGVTFLKLTADTEMRGVAIEAFGIWHNPNLLERYQSLLGEARQWLLDNGVTTE